MTAKTLLKIRPLTVNFEYLQYLRSLRFGSLCLEAPVYWWNLGNLKIKLKKTFFPSFVSG